MEDDSFDLAQWCAEHGISSRTEKLLAKEELTTINALSRLEPRDLKEMGLTIGQRKCMEIALETLTKGHDTAAEAPAPRVDTSDADATRAAGPEGGPTIADIRQQADALDSAGKTFDNLMATMQTAAAPDARPSVVGVLEPLGSSPAIVGAQDPRTILTVRSAKGKVNHITAFLSEKTKRRIRSRRKGLVLSTNGEDTVVLKTEDYHPYSGISLSEWTAANCRLMAHMLSTGELPQSHVQYYLAYTTQVAEYYEQYEWEAVLDFDCVYRERQAEYNFLWGTIPPNMELGLLARPRHRRPQPQDSGRRPFGPKKAGGGRPVCRLYMAHNGNCRFGAECKYEHPVLGDDAKNGKANGSAPHSD